MVKIFGEIVNKLQQRTESKVKSTEGRPNVLNHGTDDLDDARTASDVKFCISENLTSDAVRSRLCPSLVLPSPLSNGNDEFHQEEQTSTVLIWGKIFLGLFPPYWNTEHALP